MFPTTCCAVHCQQLLPTTIVHGCTQETITVQSLLKIIDNLFSSTIVGSSSNNIVTTIILCQHRTILINIDTIQQVLLITTLLRCCSANVTSAWSLLCISVIYALKTHNLFRPHKLIFGKIDPRITTHTVANNSFIHLKSNFV